MKVVLLDGYSLMYRAYHALAAAPMSAPDGTPTTAVHGFVSMLLRLIEDEAPERMAVAFDAKAATFRHALYTDYKATRSPMPDDLRAQDPVIREILGLMGIFMIESPGYEADDILGALSARCEASGDDALIVTGDRDAFQLAGAHTTVLYTRKGISDTVRVDADYVRERYGVNPAQLVDVKALMGDASDNIPGISGIGEKTALKLIVQYTTLEEALARAETDQKGKLRERLIEQADKAVMSKQLAAIDRNMPLDLSPADLVIGDIGGALSRLRELGMNQTATRLQKLTKRRETSVPQPEAEAVGVEIIDDLQAFQTRCAAIAKTAKWAAIDAGHAFTVAADGGAKLSLALGGGDLLTPGVTREEALAAAAPLLESNIKRYTCGITLAGDWDDVALMAYCLSPQRKGFDVETLAADAGIDASHPASALRPLAELYEESLAADGMTRLYHEIELPLSRVLREMEREGFQIDADALKSLGETFRARIAALTEEIHALAGEPVNINSPKQLSELLFEKLGLPRPKKTSLGYSTSAEVLESLAPQYPICDKILEYRKYKKLEGTYVDALIALSDENGRVHTTFEQTATATGRISSLEPNLQNIPVRTELGRGIRAAFIARPGWLLVDADYSQIELRVLAHISEDATMIDAFLNGEDIHRRTAAEVNQIAPSDVTGEMRSAAKAVNFGIVYGISDYTLARNLNVSRAQARDYIDRYFARYPGVKRYMDEIVAFARENGYVSTVLGRRRYIPEIKSENYNMRAFGERCAMNSPIQGTAADIIKLAMIRVRDRLKDAGLQARLILQVHDELLVEAPEGEADVAAQILRACMESVATLKAPLKTDISVGRNWLACK
ncbi:MAG: DNA polymerase I [Christensenellales bacterium]|jgi:DNA polymerase-1